MPKPDRKTSPPPEPRHHHLLPQFHLRRFATAGERLQVVHKDQRPPFEISATKAAAENDFYTVQTADGKRSRDVERLLSRIEDRGAAAITRILGGEFPPTKEDRTQIATFLAFEIARGRDRRHAWEMMTDWATKLMVRGVTEDQAREIFHGRRGRDPSTDELREVMKAARSPEQWKVVPHQNESIKLMLGSTPVIVPFLLPRDWVLLRFPRPILLTADTPVAFWQQVPDPSRGIGPATADEVRFALDRQHVLVLSRAGRYPGDGIWEHREDAAVAYNQSTVDAAYEWIYHHPDDRPLVGVTVSPPRTAVEIVEHQAVPSGDGRTRRLVQFRTNVPHPR